MGCQTIQCQPGCCETPPADETRECSYCADDVAPRRLAVSIAGIVDQDCTFCEAFNGDFLLDEYDPLNPECAPTIGGSAVCAQYNQHGVSLCCLWCTMIDPEFDCPDDPFDLLTIRQLSIVAALYQNGFGGNYFLEVTAVLYFGSMFGSSYYKIKWYADLGADPPDCLNFNDLALTFHSESSFNTDVDHCDPSASTCVVNSP